MSCHPQHMLISQSTYFPVAHPALRTGFGTSTSLPHPNIGNYSPTEVKTAVSGAETVAMMAEPNFDFTRRAVLSVDIPQSLVPARDMRFSLIRGGWHVSGHSDGSSLVVLPQQFSHCLRARDERVRLVRANLMMMGMIFSGDVDTDIVSDYGIFTPRCRLADIADMKQLDPRINVYNSRVTNGPLFPDWNSALATLAAAASAVK